MATVEEWREELRARVLAHPKQLSRRADLQDLDAVLEEHPDSVGLWILRGDLIQMGEESLEDYPLEEALVSYEEARRLAPDDPEPHLEIGFYFYVIEDDPTNSVPHFRRAVELGGGEAAEEGLAGALEQLDGR